MKNLLKKTFVILLMLCCVAFIVDSKTPKKRSNTKTSQVKTTPGIVNEITAQQFKQLIANWSSRPYDFKGTKPAVVDVYAPWCGPCKRLSPIMDRLAKRYSGKVNFYRIDGDKYKEIMRAYGFKSFPTIMFWDEDGFLSTHKGLTNESYYIEQINSLIN